MVGVSMKRIWSVRTCELEAPLMVSLLRNRGCERTEKAAAYLSPSLFDLHDPFLFKDMRLAVDRLMRARENGEKILIHGDYDADGVTATALLFLALTGWGFSAIVHIPERSAGYGLQSDVVRQAAEKGTGLIITVDCGVTAVEEAALAQRLGVDLIVTDHHEPGSVLPEVVALLNPKTDHGYPFGALAGVGVAFKLVQAVAQELGVQEETRRFLDIAALGTIADVVPLEGENRILVTHGLRQMAKTAHKGLRALLDECGFEEKLPQAGQVAFIMAPRINAAGRMDTCRLALNLFLTQDYEEAREFARELSRENVNRQKIEQQIVEEAHAQLALGELPRAIVLASPEWRHGVIGIVASRLVEAYHRPSYLIAVEGEVGKGSARGIAGYHVLEELARQKEWLTAFGGHVYAAGFSVRVEDIDRLRGGLNKALADAEPDLFVPRIQVEAVLTLDTIDVRVLHALEHLAPYGAGNPAPVFGFRNVSVVSVRRIGKDGRHLKLKVATETEGKITTCEVLAFNRGEEEKAVCAAGLIDLVGTLEINRYRGLETAQILMRDWAAAGEARWEEEKGQDTGSEEQGKMDEGHGAVDKPDIPDISETYGGLMNRECVADVYRNLRHRASQGLAESGIAWEEASPQECECLKILEELDLIEWLGGTRPWTLSLAKDPAKRDLAASFRYTIYSQGVTEV